MGPSRIRYTASLVVGLLLVVLLASTPASGQMRRFGSQGHATCASIASAFLTPNTLESLADIVPELQTGDLSSVASWADSVKVAPYGWSARLHYINVPNRVCTYDRARDCATYTPRGGIAQPLACLDGGQ